MHKGYYATLEMNLNKLGQDGWEFVGVQILPSDGQAPDLPFAIFKKEV